VRAEKVLVKHPALIWCRGQTSGEQPPLLYAEARNAFDSFENSGDFFSTGSA